MAENIGFMKTIAAATLMRNRRDNPLPVYDRNKYNSEYNVSEMRKSLDFEVEMIVEEIKKNKKLENLEQGKYEDEDLDKADLSQRSQYYIEELRDMIEQSRTAERKMDVETQLQRLEKTANRIAESTMQEQDKKFLLKQYQVTGKQLEEKMLPTKKGLGGVAIESAKSQVSNYMDMRSLFSGLVNNNPLAMALYGMGADITRGFFESRKRKKEQLQEDVLKDRNAEIDEQFENKRDMMNEFRQMELDELKKQKQKDEEVAEVIKQQQEAKKETEDENASYEGETNETLGRSDSGSEGILSTVNDSVAERQAEEKIQEIKDDQQIARDEEFRDGLFQRLDTMIDLFKEQSEALEKQQEEKGFSFFGNIEKMFQKLKDGIKNIAPLLLKGLGVAALVGSLVNGLFDGIKRGWDEWLESGELTKAIQKGAAGLLSGLTFGLIDAETIENFFGDVGKWIGSKVYDAVQLIKDGFSKLVDSIKEYIPFADSERETRIKKLREKVIQEDGGFLGMGETETVNVEAAGQLSNKDLKFMIDNSDDEVVKNTLQTVYENRLAALAPVENKSEKVQELTNRVVNNKIESEKASGSGNINAPSTTVINQNNVNGQGQGHTPIPLTSARNPDSSVQRIAERFMSFSFS